MNRASVVSQLQAGLVAGLLSIQVGCGSPAPPVSERGRTICRDEAAVLGTGTRSARTSRAECLKIIDERLRQEQAEQERADAEVARRAASIPPPASPTTRYIHCNIQKTAIKRASDRLATALGPWMHANANLQPSDPTYQQARKNYEAAYAALEQLIPPEMRGGRPLYPDAMRAFSNCRREDFFPN